MARVNWRPANLLNPLPVVLISTTDENGNSNVMTAAWTGTICSDPVMVSVSIRKSRYTHSIIEKTKEFVINLPNEQLALYTDYVGIYSGIKVNKLNLPGKYKVTPVESNKVKAITIDECPIALECKVKQILELGSHDMFIAEVVSTSINEDYIDKDNKLNIKKANLLSYCHGEYYTLGKRVGKFGFSSKKKQRNKRTDSINKTRNNRK
ncbi:MAG: flavin reductase family protein [Firmicutes bacterium]|nr:flavin reductase family protein [Candidatus Colivicinus equi]